MGREFQLHNNVPVLGKTDSGGQTTMVPVLLHIIYAYLKQ